MTALPYLLTTHTPTISKSGSTVTLECDDPGVAVAIFEALMAFHLPRQMTGLWATLTQEQRALVLSYDGPENHGDPAGPYADGRVVLSRDVGLTVQEGGCTCASCYPHYPYFRVCATCGNKRCPHAADHRFECHGSNEPGQVGVIADDTDADPL